MIPTEADFLVTLLVLVVPLAVFAAVALWLIERDSNGG
jgi:lipopolysaccharide export LptBFGC system permease protein LptF